MPDAAFRPFVGKARFLSWREVCWNGCSLLVNSIKDIFRIRGLKNANPTRFQHTQGLIEKGDHFACGEMLHNLEPCHPAKAIRFLLSQEVNGMPHLKVKA